MPRVGVSWFVNSVSSELCFMHCCCLLSVHQQDIDSIPTKASCRAVPWENVPTGHSGRSEQGGTYQWEQGGTSHPGTRATAAGRISMWLLCQRCCSRGASAGLQSASPPNQIDNKNKQMFCHSQPFCNRGYQRWDICLYKDLYLVKFHKAGCE